MPRARNTIACTLVVLGSFATVLAGGYEVPWKQVLPDHEHAVFEAQVEAVRGPSPGESVRHTWVQLKVIRVFQGEATRTFTARFSLTSGFGATDPAALAARREELGLVPGRRILVAVSPLDPRQGTWVGSSLGDPEGTELAAREGDTGGTRAVDYVRGHLSPVRAHSTPRPPVSDAGGGEAGAGALGQGG